MTVGELIQDVSKYPSESTVCIMGDGIEGVMVSHMEEDGVYTVWITDGGNTHGQTDTDEDDIYATLPF